MSNKREITKKEKEIANDIMQRSNLTYEEALKIATQCKEWGYTIHEQDYYKQKQKLHTIKLALKNTRIGFYKFGDDTYYALQLPNGVFIHISKEQYDFLKGVLEDE